jgi:hypothetical protein
MEFSGDSKALVISAGGSAEQKYNISVIRLEGQEAFVDANFEIESFKEHVLEDAKQIDVCL